MNRDWSHWFVERSTRDYHQKMLFSKEELEARERLCTHESPPFCSAACPMKLDVREFVRLVESGKLADARAMLDAITPLSYLLASCCEAPCEGACRLGEVGEALSIAALERAAMRHGAGRTGRGLLKIKKKKRAAVFGADLFSVALAAELARKSYPVVLYADDESAAAMFERVAPPMPRDLLEAEIARFESSDVMLELGVVPEHEFEARAHDHDLVALSGRVAKLVTSVEPDETTLWIDGIGAAPISGRDGALEQLFDARRAAVSIDRIAQGMDPSTMRGSEGPESSSLYTDMSEAKGGARLPEGEGYDAAGASEEARRCIQCSCVECIKQCAYLRHWNKHPRILTREIYNNVGIIMGDHMMNGAMNSCALCGACRVACPNGFDMGEICASARRNMVETNKLSLAVHEFALRDMIFSVEEAFLSRTDPESSSPAYVYFPGCQASAVAPETVAASYDDLRRRVPGGVGLMLGCCGAPAVWAGRYEMAREVEDIIREALSALGGPTVIAGCPTCAVTLRGIGIEVVGVWEILAKHGLPDMPREEGEAVIHDACGARCDEGARQTIRGLLGSIGVKVIEPPSTGEAAKCCGYGGLVAAANRAIAGEMSADAVDFARDAEHVSYCMACRDRYAREGVRSRHLLEYIYRTEPGDPPDISERRRRRLMLKRDLLRDVWGEGQDPSAERIDITIPDDVRAKMDERMILVEDVVRTIEEYEESGEAVIDEEGVKTARSRIGNVTFWVRFTERDGGYLIDGAYSHRMKIAPRWAVHDGER